jgi:hypothetical protein
MPRHLEDWAEWLLMSCFGFLEEQEKRRTVMSLHELACSTNSVLKKKNHSTGSIGNLTMSLKGIDILFMTIFLFLVDSVWGTV